MTECAFCDEDDIAPSNYPDHLREYCPVVGGGPNTSEDDVEEAMLDA